jgi:hypothetical protein
MAYHMAAMAGLGAAQGMMGGKQAADASSQPTQTWLDPSSELGGYDQLRDYQNYMDPGMVMDNYNAVMQKALGGGGVRGPGGGLNMKKFSNMLANWMPAEDEYTQRVRAAEYMDFADDPYYQARMQAAQQEHQESFEQQLGQNLSSFGGGGDMGMSGARMMSQNRLQDDAGENWAGALAQMDAAERGMRGQEAMSANQAYQDLRGRGITTLGSTKAADLASQASKYGSYVGAQSRNYGAGLNAALQGLMIPSALGGAGSDMMATWATQNEQGPEIDKTKAMLGGAAGGAMSGAGMGGMMGGKGGGGNPSIAAPTSNFMGSPVSMAGPTAQSFNLGTPTFNQPTSFGFGDPSQYEWGG